MSRIKTHWVAFSCSAALKRTTRGSVPSAWRRTWASERKPEETNTAYDAALRDAGWRPRTEGYCPQVAEGFASCWQRDEYVMDMWIRAPICDVPPPRPSAAPDAPSADPSVTPLATSTEFCPGALVTVSVFMAIDYHPVS